MSTRHRLARCFGMVAAELAIAAFCIEAIAADYEVPQTQYVTAGALYAQPDKGRGADYGTGASAGYARRLGQNRWLELRLFTAVLDTGAQTQIDFYQTGLDLDLVQPLGSRGQFFVLGGGGVALNDVSPSANSGSSEYLNLGLGWRGAIWENWGLRPRVELRYLYDTLDSGQSDFQLGFTVEIPPKPERVVEKIREVEKIVEVPVEVIKIVERPVICVVPTVVAAAPPAPPADTDGDGVVDPEDRCLQTLAGAKVGPDGCVQAEQTIKLPSVEFEPSSAVLTAGSKEKLEPVAVFLQNQLNVQMDVFGHTDWKGNAKSNQKLSEGRALAVMDYLVSRGIAAERLSSKGFGETQPIASNNTEQGRAQNRRVELHLHIEN